MNEDAIVRVISPWLIWWVAVKEPPTLCKRRNVDAGDCRKSAIAPGFPATTTLTAAKSPHQLR